MASLADDPNGRRRILFVNPDGERKAILLGKIDRKSAESICRHVEALLVNKLNVQPTSRETAVWLAGIGTTLHKKLASVEQIEGKLTTPKLNEWCKTYIVGRTDLALRSIARLEFASKLLVEHFGTRDGWARRWEPTPFGGKWAGRSSSSVPR